MAEYAVCPHCHNPLSQHEWVKVVRCRDCELYRPPSSDNGWNDMCAGGEGLHVTPDGFCAWGRRADG